MSKKGFVPDDAGIRKLLKSNECLGVMEEYAQKVDGTEKRPFIGFDRAKVFVKTDKKTAERYK